ncbi:hypothetical protein [Hymenobacter amundsenii]|uniref:hypothetical protein n=1 Tax=Hymenobacter amundsenii TaxID=2006685 RepID=UPI000F831DC4|nr:hypothetical protein [Hymenobacter amundsenii]
MSLRYIAFGVFFLFPIIVKSQNKLYLDLKAGVDYGYAEGAHFGLGSRPLKGHKFILQFYPSALFRYQLSDKISIATGYSGGGAGYGYKLKIPDDVTHNEFGGARAGNASIVNLDRFPILFNYQLKSYNFKPVNQENLLYLYAIKLSITGGIGASRLHGFTNNKLSFGPVLLKDTLDFDEHDPVIINKWGAYAHGGVTARFYRLGKERFNVSMYVNQGFTDLLHTQLDYTYNSRTGSQLFRSRGSGVGFAVGIPILLKTFDSKSPMSSK